MTRLIGMTALVCTLFLASVASAQDAGTARRAVLAERLVQLSAGENLTKMIESQVTADLAGLTDVPEAEARWMRANMPRMASRMVTAMLPEISSLFVETFSEAEMEAQIAFFETPVGRAIASKTLDIAVRQQEIVVEAQAAFMTELLTKYCAEFDCQGQGPAKSRSR